MIASALARLSGTSSVVASQHTSRSPGSVSPGHLQRRGDIDTAHRLLVDAIETRTQRYEAEDRTLVEALFTLMPVCFFGGRPEVWEPFDAAISRLGSRVPEVLSLRSRTYTDPIHTDVRTLDRLAAAVRSLRDEVDPTRIVRIHIVSFWIDRLFAAGDARWRVVHDGPTAGP